MKKNDFGYEQLTKSEHYKKVQNVFDNVAKEYDLMNDIMSLGLHRIWKKDFVNNVLSKKPLLIFENHLSFETSEFKENNFSNIFLVINDNEKRNITLNQKVIDFKKNLFKDQSDRLKKMKINHEIINLKDVININENVNAIYPFVGENLDFLTNNTNKNLNFLYRKIDRVSLQYCNKGFFNFKNYIPKILESLRS